MLTYLGSRRRLRAMGASSGQTGQPSGLWACAKGHEGWFRADCIRDVQILKFRVRINPQMLTKDPGQHLQ